MERNVYSRFGWQGRGPDADFESGLVRRCRRCRVGGADGLDSVLGGRGGQRRGHYWGYRNFEAQDASTNLALGHPDWREELHNNHHTYPTAAKFSVKPFEFDIGWLYISLMQKWAGPR